MSSSAIDHLVFRLEDRQFAVPLTQVREIVPALTHVPLPRAPSVVLGVIDVRGAIVPVLDVRARFGLGERPTDVSDHFILVGARPVALRVDRALEILALAPEDISDASVLARGVGLLRGIARLGTGQLVLIQDLDAFLSSDEVLALEAALAEAGA
jgi:purine-binding chemotaxis protein CheW